MAQHQRITAFSHWSTLRVIMVLSVVEFAFGLGLGFAFQDQLVPATDPYLAPIRDWLGITTPTVPIPSMAAPMAPDASASASAATSVHVDAPPLVGTVRRRVAVPAVMPLGVGSPGTATTTITITQSPAAKDPSTPIRATPPVITTTKEPTSVQRPNDAVRETSATERGTTTVTTPQRVTSTSPVTGATEPGTSTVGTSTSSASTSDSPPDLQRVGLAAESERHGGTGTSADASSGGTPTQPATDPTGDAAAGAGAGPEPAHRA